MYGEACDGCSDYEERFFHRSGWDSSASGGRAPHFGGGSSESRHSRSTIRMGFHPFCKR
jgi:hypothetical protein